MGLLYAKELVNLTAEIAQRREENLKLVQLRFQSGLENKGSYLLSQAYLAQAKFDNLQARDSIRQAQSQLARALGLDHYNDLDVTGDIPVRAPPVQPVPLRDLAVQTPDYAQAVAQEDSNIAAVRVARAPFFPSPNLTGTAGNNDTNFFPSAGGNWTMGVNLTFSFLNGGKDFYTTRSAIESQGSSEAARINVSRQTLAKLEQVYDSYVEGVAAFDVAREFREAATLRAEIARKRYNNGLLLFEEWDTIETDLINRQKNYLQSKHDRVVVEATWEQALGKGVIQLKPLLNRLGLSWWRLLLLVVVMIGLGIGYSFWSANKKEKETYRENKVERGTIITTIFSTGTVNPENRLEMKPAIAGRAEEVLVNEGEKVKKGQVIALISSSERATLLDAARAEGPEEVKRWESIYRPTPLVSPIDGTVIARNIKNGQTFAVTDVIFVLSDRLTVKAQVDETDISQIRLKQLAELTLDAYPNQKIPAKVDQIAFDARTVSNVTTYTVDVLPDHTPDYMLSGMTANVTFFSDKHENVLLVPSDTIRMEVGFTTVLVRTTTASFTAKW